MRVPAGWQVVRVIEGRGVTVALPGRLSPALDILFWQPIAEDLSVQAAAEAHERVLGIRRSYVRRTRETFSAADGSAAVLAIGELRTDERTPHISLTAAYVIDTRYFVVGAFCDPAQVQQVRDTFFDEAMRTFGPGGAPVDPAPVPPEPVTPVPAEGGSAPPPAGNPDTTPDPEPAPWPMTHYQHDAGISMRVPTGWDVRVASGCLLATGQGDDAGYSVAVWPLLTDPDTPPEQRAKNALREWARLVQTPWQQSSQRAVPSPVSTAIFAGSAQHDGVSRRVVAMVARGDGLDLLQVAMFPSQAPVARRLQLANMLSSLEAASFAIASPESQAGGPWTGGDGALHSEAPAGWLVTGGVTLYNQTPAIRIEGTHPRTGASFSWLQPRTPFHKDLTPELASMGWRAGAEFPPDYGIEPLALARRATPLASVREYVLSTGGLSMKESGVSSHAAELLPGGEGAFARAQGPGGATASLFCTADTPQRLGAGCWMSAALSYTGAVQAHEAAGAALRSLILQARPDTSWPATGEQRATLHKLLQGAQQAAEGLPSEASGEGTTNPTVEPLLTRLAPAGVPGAVTIRLPRQDTSLWRQASTEAAATQTLPELLARP